jgi:hypothetical protein
MIPTVPFWLRQRQVKVEPVNETALKLAAPQLPVYEAAVQPAEGSAGWVATLYGPPEASGAKPQIAQHVVGDVDEAEAWDVAFELYRTHVIV